MDRGEWWVIVHEFAKVWQDWATNIFTSIVIILFGAWGRENTNILTCLFSHVTCIHRDYRILPPWLLEIWYKDVAFFFSFFLSFFSFWCTWMAEVNAAKIKPYKASALSLRKRSKSEKMFPIQVCKELCPLSFHRKLKWWEAVLFALGSWRQLWCWPAREAQLSIRANFSEEEGSCINRLSTETSFLKGCFFRLITMFLRKNLLCQLLADQYSQYHHSNLHNIQCYF